MLEKKLPRCPICNRIALTQVSSQVARACHESVYDESSHPQADEYFNTSFSVHPIPAVSAVGYHMASTSSERIVECETNSCILIAGCVVVEKSSFRAPMREYGLATA